jgi:hypothetical protein
MAAAEHIPSFPLAPSTSAPSRLHRPASKFHFKTINIARAIHIVNYFDTHCLSLTAGMPTCAAICSLIQAKMLRPSAPKMLP